MVKQVNTGKNPASKALREAERIAQLPPALQKAHPTAVRSNPEKLRHINTYGCLPEYYLDQPFTCRHCGKREIWMARDQKWYYEEAKGHIDAIAVECHDCRKQRKSGSENQ